MSSVGAYHPTPARPSLFLFSTDVEFSVAATSSGVDHVIVDWERGEKFARQAGTPFQIGQDTVEDVRRLAQGNNVPVFVRINPIGDETAQEIALALSAGAKGIMLPMARDRDEVAAFLGLVPEGVSTLIQIETKELAANPESLQDLSWDFAHVGLNDLMLSRGADSIWTSVLDGTVERICRSLDGRHFGFGGMTVVDGGFPIPARLVILDMSRLGCSMGVLRRSFTLDMAGRDMRNEVSSIRQLLADGAARDSDAVAGDLLALKRAIRGEDE